MRIHTRIRAAIVAGLLTSLAIGETAAQAPATSEYQVKAAYLYNFGRFVQWPAPGAAGEPFTICVLGDDPFGPILDKTLDGAAIGGSAVVARRIGGPGEAGSCHILFISTSEAPQLGETLTRLEKTSVLTVSDLPDFVQRGGVIQFVHAGNRVRFEINLTRAQNAGLVLSSDLLKVAVAVRKTSRSGD